ncbi:MAG TPA: hypothetical protein VFZ26_17030 [Gemmatimonadales bacterium]
MRRPAAPAHPAADTFSGAGVRLSVAILCATLLLGGPPAAAQAPPPMPSAERVRLAEALRLGDALRERLWPGWGSIATPVLLVTDHAEYLVAHPRPTPEFRSLGRDALLGREVLARPRVFEPTLLAAFPAVNGVPTVVVGTPERTGKRSAEWVASVLHEQFHLWQYSLPDYYARVAALGLAGDDSTGRWMLEFPFPYDSPPVGRAVERLASALARPAARDTPALSGVRAARGALRSVLTPAEERYLEFQLWQEGTARFIEIMAVRAAAAAEPPDSAFRALPDYEPYRSTADRLERRLRDQLQGLRLDRDRRTAFYPLGAALARLLDTLRPDWKRRYADGPPRLDHLLEGSSTGR